MNKYSLLLISTFFVTHGFTQDANTDISDPSLTSVSVTEDESDTQSKAETTLPEPEKIEAKDRFNLSYYEPMYFLFGNPTSKVNFSFKYQGIRRIPLYFGYVQNIFWLLKEDSKPFRDANFNPRFFYRYQFDTKSEHDYLDVILYEHKSNGKGPPESRSYDSAGAKLNRHFSYENWTVDAYAKALYRYALDRTNRDFEEYVGPVEMGVTFSQFSYALLDKAELSYRVYTGGKWGQDFRRTSHEVGLSFRFFGEELTPALYFQYFNGYSESLLHYNKREENFRIGFLL